MRTAPLHKTKIIFISVVVIVLFLIIAAFISISTKPTEEEGFRRPTATPIVINQGNTVSGNENNVTFPTLNPKNIPVPKVNVYTGTDNTGSWKTTLIADPEDTDWLTNKPVNVRSSTNLVNNEVSVHWEDPMAVNTAYMWLIGYHHEPFDPVEKFREENIPTILWNTIDVAPAYPNTVTTRLKTLTLDGIYPEASNVYFYIYKRLPEKNGSYRDFLYGAHEGISGPYIQTMKKF